MGIPLQSRGQMHRSRERPRGDENEDLPRFEVIPVADNGVNQRLEDRGIATPVCSKVDDQAIRTSLPGHRETVNELLEVPRLPFK